VCLLKGRGGREGTPKWTQRTVGRGADLELLLERRVVARFFVHVAPVPRFPMRDYACTAVVRELGLAGSPCLHRCGQLYEMSYKKKSVFRSQSVELQIHGVLKSPVDLLRNRNKENTTDVQVLTMLRAAARARPMTTVVGVPTSERAKYRKLSESPISRYRASQGPHNDHPRV